MKVEIWSDFISLESYLGKQHLKKAIDQFPHNKYVVIEHKTFLLKQNLNSSPRHHSVTKPNNGGQNIDTLDQTDTIQLASIRHRTVDKIDTILAHRLAHFARTKNKGRECVDQIFTAHFAEYKLIDDLTTLSAIAEKIGLCPIEVGKVLRSNKYTRQIDIDLDEAQQIGVNTLPFIVINETYALPGSYTANEYLEVLISIWEEIKHNPR